MEDSRHEWTKDETKILVSWCQKSAGQRWLHDKACRHYRKINNRFSYVSIILSTIAGIGGFSAETNLAWFRYLLASVNIFTGLLNSFQKFVRAAEKSEAHTSVARQFASFVRTVALELSLEPEKRENASDFLKQCKSDYERMCTMAPDVPERIIKAFNAKYPDVKSRPDMCNGMSTMEFSYWKPGTKKLADSALRKLKILRGWKDQVPEFREPV